MAGLGSRAVTRALESSRLQSKLKWKMQRTLQHQADMFLTQTALSSAPRLQICISSSLLKPNCGRAPYTRSNLEVSEKLTNGFLLKSKAAGIVLGCSTRLKCHVLTIKYTGMVERKKRSEGDFQKQLALGDVESCAAPSAPVTHVTAAEILIQRR